MTKRRGGIVLGIAAATVVGCGHAPAPQPSRPAPPAAPPPSQNLIAVDSDGNVTAGSPEAIAAWTVYGLRLAAAATATGHATDYADEVQARAALAEDWKPARADARPADRYLDQLVEVREAGFMAEYVLVYLARPGWVVPGAELVKLRPAAFEAWALSRLGAQHVPEARATVRLAAGVRPLSVPGERLPASEEIDPQRVSCARAAPAAATALARWDEEQARLGQVAVAAESQQQLLVAIEGAALDARARRDGVVLVSPRVATTMFIAGFCAVDRGAFAEAERTLRRTVALAPGSTGARSELIQALMSQKKLDEADAELDAALRLRTSPCDAGLLWRKRGYILFDRGKLVDSYRAYAHSLEFDPGSEIARNEMRAIVSELHRAGGYDAKALGGYSPPPAGKMTVTKCK